MTLKDARRLPLGLYRVHWKQSEGGGSSLAAVGMLENGDPWLAPTNWVHPSEDVSTWRTVSRVDLIKVPASAPNDWAALALVNLRELAREGLRELPAAVAARVRRQLGDA